MKKILITGGTGLLGKEMVKGFLRKKCTVYFTSTSKSKSEQFLKNISSDLRKNCIPIVQKFENIDDISSFVKKNKNLNFNVLVNNARNISNLKLNTKNSDHYKCFDKEMFLAVYLPYFLSIKLNQSCDKEQYRKQKGTQCHFF